MTSHAAGSPQSTAAPTRSGCLIADAVDGRLRDVHREMRIVRLGQGVDATGQFAPEAIERTKAALTDYAELLRRHDVAQGANGGDVGDP